MAIIPLGPIHGLGIREIRTQLANCRPRIRRWNSIERNAITVFLPGREGMEASGEPISEIHVSIHDALPRNICHSAMNFSTSRIKSWQGTIIYRRKIAKWILNFELAFKLDERGFVGRIYKKKKKIVLYVILFIPNIANGSSDLSLNGGFSTKGIKLLTKVNEWLNKCFLGYSNAF